MQTSLGRQGCHTEGLGTAGVSLAASLAAPEALTANTAMNDFLLLGNKLPSSNCITYRAELLDWGEIIPEEEMAPLTHLFLRLFWKLKCTA